MPNFDFITPQLATGGDCNSADDVRAVAAAGITHVIDCRYECDDCLSFGRYAPEIRYLHLGVDDAGNRQPAWWYDDGVAFALIAMADPDAKVLAHCHMGINRGPSMAFAILLALGHDPVEAHRMIRAARPIAHIWYAEDALANRLAVDGVPTTDAMTQFRRLRAEREADPHDMASIIRRIRATEGVA